MRWFLPALLVAVAIGTTTGGAGAAPTAATIQGNCGTKTMSVLFWPKGHKAIPLLGYPAWKIPHVEVFRYKGGTTFLSKNQVAYAGTDKNIVLAKSCARVADRKTFQQVPAQGIRTASALTCSFSKPAHVQIRKVAGAGVRHEVYLIDPPNKVVLRAQIAPQGTNLSYSFSNCTRANAPGG